MYKNLNCRSLCKSKTLAVPKQTKTTKIRFNYTQPISACVTFSGNEYFIENVDSNNKLDGHWDASQKNDDLWNCPDPTCIRRGVQWFNRSLTQIAPARCNGYVYQIPDLTSNYAFGGVITGILHSSVKQKLSVNVYLSSELAQTPTNAYQYIMFVDVDENGQGKIEIPLSQVPTFIRGTGWDKTAEKSYMSVQITGTAGTNGVGDAVDLPADDPSLVIGLGEWSVYYSDDAFRQNNTGFITCTDTLEFNPTVDPTDPDCVEQLIDEDSLDASITITAKRVTGNFWDSSPMMRKLDDEVTSISEEYCAVVPSNGKLLLEQFYSDECGFIWAQADNCNADESQLTYNSLEYLPAGGTDIGTIESQPYMYRPTGNDFYVAKEDDGEYYAYFSDMYIGNTVTIGYPVRRDNIEAYEINNGAGEIPSVRVEWITRIVDGWSWKIVVNGFFNNIPLGWSGTENTAMEFTFTPIAKNGVIGHAYKIKA